VAVLISFLSHYPMIASAPSHAASIAPDLFGSAERVKELGQSNWYQSFAPEPVPTVKKAAAVKAADTAKAANSSQPVAAPEQTAALHSDIDSRSLAQLTAIHDADLRFLKREKVRDQQGNYCDPKFVGETLTFSQSVGSTLDELLNQIHNRIGINIVLGPKVGRLPINVKSEDPPWTTILRSQLFVLGVGATCVDSRTIQLIKNDDVTALEKAEHESAKVETHYIKLKYLQPSSSENKNIAGQSSSSSSSSGGQGGAGGSGGCQQNQGGAGGGGGGQQQNIPQRCKFERLMIEIGQILGISGNQGGVNTYAQGPNQPNGQEPIYTGGYGSPYKPYVGQVPGRNMLVVRGTKRQLDEVNELIKHADIPPFQVVIRGLVYTANEDKLRDIGVQTTITARTGDNRTSGGIFGQSVGGLGTLFDFSTVVGTVDFNVQANALQQNGVISIKSRPFATVLDGITTDLTVGRQVPVIIQAANNIGGSPGTLQILQAANLLSVTPHVIDDDQGNPTAVNLELQLESNDVDTSVLSQGVPAVSVRSIQSNFILNQEQTAILGGFTVDSDNKTVTKTPGLGDIPILGELFKRHVRSNQINRLYFAISVSVIPYGGVIEPVTVPGATTAPPSITPKMEERGKEPKAVVPPKGP
jgi:type II secretory pathway component GspD/PulD (secretin)